MPILNNVPTIYRHKSLTLDNALADVIRACRILEAHFAHLGVAPTIRITEDPKARGFAVEVEWLSGVGRSANTWWQVFGVNAGTVAELRRLFTMEVTHVRLAEKMWNEITAFEPRRQDPRMPNVA